MNSDFKDLLRYLNKSKLKKLAGRPQDKLDLERLKQRLHAKKERSL